MKEYTVNMQARCRKAYTVKAENEDEAQDKARELFNKTTIEEMTRADVEADVD